MRVADQQGPALDGIHVAYVSEYDLNSAVSSRLRMQGVASSLRIAGAEVTVMGAQELAHFAGSTPATWRRAVNLGGWMPVPGLRQALIEYAPDLILLYGVHLGMLRGCRRAARTLGAVLAVDAVEWFDPSGMRFGRIGPYRLTHDYAMAHIGGFVALGIGVSSFLVKHLEMHGVQAIRVPPLFCASPELIDDPPHVDDGPVRFCFSGSVGTKDWNSLKNLIVATRQLDPVGDRIVVHVVGEVPAIRLGLVEAAEVDRGRVVLHGRVPHESAVNVVSSCDYTVLQRSPSLRNVQAGFPSKMAESLALGVPVVSNRFSDVGDYLEDGANAVLLGGDDVEAMRGGIRVAVARRSQWNRAAIAEDARSKFSPQRYSGPLAHHLKRR